MVATVGAGGNFGPLSDGLRALRARVRAAVPGRSALRRLAGALLLAAAAAPEAARAADGDGAAPYPPSARLTGMSLDWSTFRRSALGSDNWTSTWAADGSVYTTFGDGDGFNQGASRRAYVSLGVAQLYGSSAGTLRGENLIGGVNARIAPCFPRLGGDVDRRGFATRFGTCGERGLHGKSYSILALDNQLYMFISPGSLNRGYAEGRLFKARIGTNAWTRAPWAFLPRDNPPLLAPNIVQAGRDNADSAFVYAYATRLAPTGRFGLHKGPGGGEIHLLRASRGADLMQRASWQFFAGQTGNGAVWSGQQSASRPVFVDPRGVSWIPSVIHARALGRYVLITEHDESHAGQLGVFEAPDPWGPWSTVFYGTLSNPSAGVPPTAFYASFLANSLGADGRFTLTFTGTGINDSLNAVDGRFALGGNGGRP